LFTKNHGKQIDSPVRHFVLLFKLFSLKFVLLKLVYVICMHLRSNKQLPEMVCPNHNASSTSNATSASIAASIANASNATSNAQNDVRVRQVY